MTSLQLQTDQFINGSEYNGGLGVGLGLELGKYL